MTGPDRRDAVELCSDGSEGGTYRATYDRSVVSPSEAVMLVLTEADGGNIVYVLCFCRVSVFGRSVAVRVFGFVVVMCVFVCSSVDSGSVVASAAV